MTFVRVDHANSVQMWVNTDKISTLYTVADGAEKMLTHIRLDDGNVVITPNAPIEIFEKMLDPDGGPQALFTPYAPTPNPWGETR